MITAEAIKTFRPSPAMIGAAKAVFAAMAYRDTIEPIVKGYQREILTRYQFRVSDKWQKRGLAGDVITDVDDTYLMSDTDFRVYLNECRKARDNAGLKVEHDDFCPLLVAEHLVSQAENCLIDLMAPLVDVTRSQVNSRLELRARFLDINLRLLAPWVR